MPSGNQEPRSNHPKSCLADLELLKGRQSSNVFISVFHLETKISGRGHSTQVELEGNFSQLQRFPQGLAQGVPPAPGWDFCLQSLIQSCLMAQLRASPQIPTRGLREAAEEGRLEAEDAVPLQSHGIPSLGAGGLGHGRFWVENPGFTEKPG